jgi:hypothetical protein
MLRLVRNAPAARADYVALILRLTAQFPSENEWKAEVIPLISNVVLSVVTETPGKADAKEFLTWRPERDATMVGATSSSRDNLFRYPADNPKVSIRAGSIHSVKGETHTSTLVLDTFYRKSNLKSLLPWLTGTRVGTSSKEGRQNVDRLKQHYVAMTRPTHLLCLAMREDHLSKDDVEKLKARWRVVRVTPTGTLQL